MNNVLTTVFIKDSKPVEIQGITNKRIRLVKAFAIDDTDFMLYPNLTLKLGYGVGYGKNEISRSFATFIDPYQANSRVVEFQNYIFPPSMGLKMEVVNRDSNKIKPFEIGIVYEFI